jgi:regulatory protein
VTDYERKPRLLDREALLQYALKSLAGRAQSAGELRERLRRRAANQNDVAPILEQLNDHGYLNDRRFAEGFAAARLHNEKFGRTRVIQDLRQRRIAPVVAEGTVRQVYEGVDESALIEDWIRRKYRFATREDLFQDEKDLASAYRRLLRAGFRTGEILTVLKRFAKNPELLDDFEPREENSGEPL